MTISSDFIKQAASDAGFSLCGIACARRLDSMQKSFESWLNAGNASTLGYLSRNVGKRFDPDSLFDGARSVVVCAVNYKNEFSLQPSDPDLPKVASYSVLRDYHLTIMDMLGRLLIQLQGQYPRLKGRGFVDSAPVAEKFWAREAGLGWIGRNSLLVTPQYGSFVFLGELFLDMECDRYDRPMENRCGKCTICLSRCPVGAINADRTIDTRKCISRLTVEPVSKGSNVDKRSLSGWLFGCDACQSGCPRNRNTPYYSNPGFRPLMGPEQMGEGFWYELDCDHFEKIFCNTPMQRAGYGRIISNLPDRE